MMIIDEILPKVKAEVRLDKDNKTLWIKTDTLDGYGRIIIEDGSIWCRIFYEDYEDEPTISKMEQVDEPQTDYGDYERAVEQMQHDMRYEPTYNAEDGSM